ncbi:ABC transporter permease [Halobacillus sp. BAB-2008]|uniref:ABC transporter permease n=1 Tax=Halobacillus sp. BAB-2008 TaxID=1246484 RepID=UPI0002A4D61C|nr:ABC transporter permease [Halobacillus sp. BAB-2008]ELK44215.1 ABC-type transport system permease [Halobacillus sp. BAB-2008]
MNINQLIIRNLKKNVKNYYLYSFALIFSVALYFSFVTLQYDPAMSMDGSIKGEAALRVASVLLIAIVAIFLIYANNIFIKRRGKEIGLFQLIGMTKNRIFRLISLENLIVYFGSLIVGTFAGFAVSKLMMMALFRITDIEEVATLSFSGKALIQTILVFMAIYLFIMLLNYFFIRRQSILSLFRTKSKTETRVGNISVWEILMGIFGLTLIIAGYYVSSKLFSGDFNSMNQLFAAMVFILAAVIIGTYFFYKGSVRFVSNLLRKNKQGYLNINEVLSLSSMMFRMKSNAMLLTIITTVSALAIGLLSLTYISYYSVYDVGSISSPDDFSFVSEEDAAAYTEALDQTGIAYSEEKVDVTDARVMVKDIFGTNLEEMQIENNQMDMPVVADTALEDTVLEDDQVLFAGYNDAYMQMSQLKDEGKVQLITSEGKMDADYIGSTKENVLSRAFTFGAPAAVVSENTFQKLKQEQLDDIQTTYDTYTGVNVEDRADIETADDIFQSMTFAKENENLSLYAQTESQKKTMGLSMFIVGFLGLTFLVTSGCVLYFKQMDEGDEEKPNYTILRKLGFSRGDLLRGIQGKQLFNFGIPLVVGLLHSYFAVQSGWFFFGTELWTPMFVVMGVYTLLYSVFGLLSVLYYKRIIKEAL